MIGNIITITITIAITTFAAVMVYWVFEKPFLIARLANQDRKITLK